MISFIHVPMATTCVYKLVAIKNKTKKNVNPFDEPNIKHVLMTGRKRVSMENSNSLQTDYNWQQLIISSSLEQLAVRQHFPPESNSDLYFLVVM